MPTTHIEIMGDNNGSSTTVEESVEQLRAKLDAMKKIMDDPEKKARRRNQAGSSIIDGSFLSIVFTIVLLMIVGVSLYAFFNLYYAILKKFQPKQHTEL